MTTEEAPVGKRAGDEPAAEMERLHPFTLLHRLIVSVPALVVVLLPVLRRPDAGAWLSVTVLAIYGIAVLPLLLVQYLRFRYAVTPDEIIIHKGVFTYQHRNIPIERIQNIEIEQRLLPRMLGTAKVKIETAGSSSTEGVIEYVTLERARAIRASVRAHQLALRESRRERQPESGRERERDRHAGFGAAKPGGTDGDRADRDRLGSETTYHGRGDRVGGGQADGDLVGGGQAEGDRVGGGPADGDREGGGPAEGDRVGGGPAHEDRAGDGQAERDRAAGGQAEGDGAERDRVDGGQAARDSADQHRAERDRAGRDGADRYGSDAETLHGGARRAPTSLPFSVSADEPSVELLYSMPLGRVLLSGAFRFSLLYIAMIFTATEYLGLRPEDVARWISGNRMDYFDQLMEGSPVLVVLSTIVIVGTLAWITGILTNLGRFYGFRLGYEDGKLHTRHGLLTVSEGTIPLKKIQALIIRTNPLMQAFGWYRLELQTMGFDPNDRGYRVAAPFAREDEVLSIAQRIRPFELPEEFRSVSKIMIRRTFARYTLVFLPLTAVTTYFWDWGPWLLLALPLLFALAERQYRHHGFEANDTYLFVRRGVFRRLLWILPAERFQVFYMTQTIFQRRLGVQSLYVDTPGAGVMAHPVIVDLPEDEARSLLDVTYARFQRLFQRRHEKVDD